MAENKILGLGVPCRFPAFHGGERMVGAVSKHRGWWQDSRCPRRKRGWGLRLFSGSVRSDCCSGEMGNVAVSGESEDTDLSCHPITRGGPSLALWAVLFYPPMSARNPKSIPGGLLSDMVESMDPLDAECKPSKSNRRSAARAITLLVHPPSQLSSFWVFAVAGRVEPRLYRREAAFARTVLITLGGLGKRKKRDWATERLRCDDGPHGRRETRAARKTMRLVLCTGK